MSAIANLRGAPAAFPPVNLHQHGHKRGGHVQATDDTGTGTDSAAQVPPGLRQTLFGSLLNSLEQAIGVQLTGATGSANAPATGSANAATADATATAAGGANAAAPASSAAASAQTSVTLLQNYLNNLAHNSHTDGSPAAKSAGSNVSVNA